MLLVEKADYKLITRIHDEVKAKQISKKKKKIITNWLCK